MKSLLILSKNFNTLLVFILAAFPVVLSGQVLHTENFNVILDTSKKVSGTFVPSFRYRNVRERFVEVQNTADISIRLKKNGFTIANKLEYAKFGTEEIMSGGFVFLEYRRSSNSKKLVLEPYFLMLWQEIRGLEMKRAIGANVRYRLIFKPKLGLFAGIGTFYEYERWNNTRVSDDVNLIGVQSISKLRGSAYLSFKDALGENFTLDVSVYYQPSLTEPSKNYRFASSSELTYKITKSIGLSLLYQNTYDPSPVIEIDPLFNDINLGLAFSF